MVKAGQAQHPCRGRLLSSAARCDTHNAHACAHADADAHARTNECTYTHARRRRGMATHGACPGCCRPAHACGPMIPDAYGTRCLHDAPGGRQARGLPERCSARSAPHLPARSAVASRCAASAARDAAWPRRVRQRRQQRGRHGMRTLPPCRHAYGMLPPGMGAIHALHLCTMARGARTIHA